MRYAIVSFCMLFIAYYTELSFMNKIIIIIYIRLYLYLYVQYLFYVQLYDCGEWSVHLLSIDKYMKEDFTIFLLL